MPYDEELAERVRALVAAGPGVTERRMFGGLAFLIDGRMSVSATGDGGLMVRVDPAGAGPLLDEPGVGPVVMRGRELDGWLRVDAGAVRSDDALRAWVERSVSYARTLTR